ncbi:SAV_2336 N-terminal domain-related protein [Nocardiopsis sp. CC223A]|uniref:SAV_2336 N-terminal domain-related protein n=1 Tax=Nocardiopsis sp. CC223A TaxID=3044051 RepID=UPI00278C0B88|nr:SAV_2336 N-terminal domain-related protein [Nocardiopsis sp. CC223A]
MSWGEAYAHACRLRASDTPITPEERAEALWLSAQIVLAETAAPHPAATEDSVLADAPPTPDREPEHEPQTPTVHTERGSAQRAHPTRVPDPPDTGGGTSVSEAAPGEIHMPSGPDGEEGGPAHRLQLGLPPMITERLKLQQALRHLKRHVPAPHRMTLDEEATARGIAENALVHDFPWLPVMVPDRERWLSLLLVIDTGPSMEVWRPLAGELRTLLDDVGVFRVIHERHVVRSPQSHTGGLGLAVSPNGPPRDPATEVDPSARRMTLVLSDCSGAHWWEGRAAALLHLLAGSGPTAVVQPLSERQWRATGAPTLRHLVRNPRPGAPNREFVVGLPGDALPAPAGTLPVPVVRCEAGSLKDWADLVVSSGRPVSMPVTHVHRTDGYSMSPTVTTERGRGIRDRVVGFRDTASREAFLLAAHTALSLPNLAIMRLIQAELVERRLLSSLDPGILSEVLLSGLLKTVDGQPRTYEFIEGAAEALVAELPRNSAVHTAHRLIELSRSPDAVRSHGRSMTADVVLPGDPAGDRPVPPGSRPVALLNPRVVPLLRRADPLRTRAATGKSGGAASDSAHRPRTEPTAEGSIPREPRALPHLPLVPWPPPAPPPSARFVTRDGIAPVISTFADGGALALVGPAGTGKSTIAAVLAGQAAGSPSFDLVLWVDASHPERAREALAHAAGTILIPPARDRDTEVADLLAWTQRTTWRWFVIMDGVAHRETLDLIPPARGRGRVLVTTRDRELVPASALPVRVPSFDTAEATDHLVRLLGDTPWKGSPHLHGLGTLLRGHPLSLTIAAAHITTYRIPPEDYASRWAKTSGHIVDDTLHRTVQCSLEVWEAREGARSLAARNLLFALKLLGREVPGELLRTRALRLRMAALLKADTFSPDSLRHHLSRAGLIIVDGTGPGDVVRLVGGITVPFHEPWYASIVDTARATVRALVEAWHAADSPVLRARLRSCALSLAEGESMMLPPERSGVDLRARVADYRGLTSDMLATVLGPDLPRTTTKQNRP